MTNYHLTPKSSNAKTGPIPVTTSAASTCPPSCAFINNGCYADSGPLKLHWLKVSDGSRGTDLATLCASIAKFPVGTLWRHNQAGDLPGAGDAIDAAQLAQLVKANTGRRGFTYTHKPMTSQANRAAVAAANKAGFTINLSANNLAHADQLADLNIAPVAVVVPIDQVTNTVTPAGRAVVICPATIRDDVTCLSCQMCQRGATSARPIIGFPAHGTQAKKAQAAVIKFHHTRKGS